MLLNNLKAEGLYLCIQCEYALDGEGNKTQRVIKDLLWTSPEQIKLARRFFSDFMYETDATFNTNCLRLPLSVTIGIDNTGKMFPMVYCYITSESAALAAKALVDQAGLDPNNEVLQQLDTTKLLEVTKALVGASRAQPVRLRLCKWHAVEAINRRLVSAGWYKKER
jgi:hypothetical protein